MASGMVNLEIIKEWIYFQRLKNSLQAIIS